MIRKHKFKSTYDSEGAGGRDCECGPKDGHIPEDMVHKKQLDSLNFSTIVKDRKTKVTTRMVNKCVCMYMCVVLCGTVPCVCNPPEL